MKPQSEPAPAELRTAAARAESSNGAPGDRLRRAGEAAFAALVRGRSDAQLDRFMGSDAALRLFFKAMEQAFVPSAAGGFQGAIQYELSTARGGTRRWALVVHDGHARAVRGGAPDPALTLRASVPLFMRIAAGEMSAPKAILDGDLELEGDFQLAARMDAMFGTDSPW